MCLKLLNTQCKNLAKNSQCKTNELVNLYSPPNYIFGNETSLLFKYFDFLIRNYCSHTFIHFPPPNLSFPTWPMTCPLISCFIHFQPHALPHLHILKLRVGKETTSHFSTLGNEKEIWPHFFMLGEAFEARLHKPCFDFALCEYVLSTQPYFKGFILH